MTEMSKENWGAGDPYELYVGRWSRQCAAPARRSTLHPFPQGGKTVGQFAADSDPALSRMAHGSKTRLLDVLASGGRFTATRWTKGSD